MKRGGRDDRSRELQARSCTSMHVVVRLCILA
jgi:hypothetical protein